MSTAHGRFRAWTQDGTWAQLKAAVIAVAEADGDIDWAAQVDSTIVRAHQPASGARKEAQSGGFAGAARPGSLQWGTDQQGAHYVRRAGSVARRAGGVGRPRKRPESLSADEAYSRKANRPALRSRKIVAVIPERNDEKANRVRKGSSDGRPPGFDEIRYKNRNQIERGFGRREQWRGLATRYDKLGESYQATLDIAETLDWLRATPTTYMIRHTRPN